MSTKLLPLSENCTAPMCSSFGSCGENSNGGFTDLTDDS
ncbi:hypothetical protein A2U01_0112997, partial [Trifolium medium]|nr:hypothetical protein [Trifolium medium]